MKKQITTLLVAVLLSTSCSENILELENKGALTVDNWYQTADDFQAALNTCYITFMERGMYALMLTWTAGHVRGQNAFRDHCPRQAEHHVFLK